MTFLNVFKHLLPNARAWRITVDKQLRQFFDGLSASGDDIKLFFDEILFDILPARTRELDAWEDQFGLRRTGALSEAERRLRLDAAWKSIGGQDPRYIQDTLQANGFNVFIHEWWEPGTEPAPGVKACTTPRNPLLVLRNTSGSITYVAECGELLAQCGEVTAEAGNTLDPQGYPLVNKVVMTTPAIIGCGELLAEAGETVIECGNFSEFVEIPLEYTIPTDPLKWPYFLYIGGETFGDLAQVDPARKDEFEELCLKICPTQQWLGILVEYV